MSEATIQSKRDYSLFEAELSGNVLNFRLLRRLMRWIRPYWRTFTLSIVLVLIASFLAIVLPIILSIVVIDHIIVDGAGTAMQSTSAISESANVYRDLGTIATTEWLAQQTGFSLLLAACLFYGVVQILWAISSHYHRLTLITAVIKGLRDLRRDLFVHLETRPSSFYDQVAVGRVMTRVTNDVEALYELLRGMGSLIGEFVPFLYALVIMFIIDIEITGVLLLYLPVMVFVTLVFRRYTRRLFRLVRQSISAMNQNLQENLSGLQVVQLSHREDFNERRYRRLNSNNLNFETRSMRLETLYGSFNDSMAAVALGVILWFGGGQVIQNEIGIGEMILFTRFIDMLFHPIVVLGEQLNILFRAMASGERIFQALDWDEAIHEPQKPIALPTRLRGEVEFRNLDFQYRDVPIIQDVSFKIASGEKLAIVGPTGSGKSTLIRLLGRFYDFADNSIFLDGVDLNAIRTRDVRSRIGVVLQDFHIFSGTIYDNIALGNAEITREKVIAAAEQVNTHQFIMEMPKQYDTELSERGQNLSQGQRQLLAFARVLASDPEILVLDEATANIDTATELLIQDALRKVTSGRTSIIIAHRLQTIQDSDRVLVLADGRVAEIGTHDELLVQGGLYHQLHTLQFQETSDS